MYVCIVCVAMAVETKFAVVLIDCRCSSVKIKTIDS